MKRLPTSWLLGVLILGFTPGMLFGQATSQISGRVTDPTGAVLPGVDVTATQTDTGVARTTLTNETGSYVLPNLALGPYRLTAALPGFRTFLQTGIVLEVNSSPAINVVLEVGEVTETVEVQANAAMVETRNVGVSQVMENARILELPLNGRQVTELIALSGAVTRGETNSGFGIPWNSTAVSIAGGLATGVHYVLDGATHNNPSNNLELPLPFPDALQEFKVETSALAAQSGVHAAGAVNSVTKSGTNEFHGDLFEFVRNYKFNARNFFASERDTLKRNQFGGTLGGPILRDRLFFFAGYQGTLVRQDAAENVSFVPTPAVLAGDFTAVASPECNGGRPITLNGPFIDNQIDPARFSPAAVNIAKRLPTTPDPCGRIVWGGRGVENGHQAVGRIDYQRGPSHSLFGRYMVTTLDVPPPFTLTPNLLVSNIVGTDSMAQAFTLGDTYLIGSNLVNSFRLTANRSATRRIGPSEGEFFSVADIGVNMFSYVKCSNVRVTGAFTIGCASGSPGKINIGIFGLSDDVSLIAGNHQIAFGVSARQWHYNYESNFASPGRFDFNGQVTGLGMADLMMGNVFQLRQGSPNFQRTRTRYLGVYGQDVWRATPRLTLTAGLRWEPFLPMVYLDGTVQHFDLEAYRAGTRTTQFQNAPPGLFYPGDPGFPGHEGAYKQWWNVSPRVGLAWDASGDGRTSVRASYGLAYDYPSTQFHINTNFGPPWVLTTFLRGVSFDDPYRDFPGGNPFPFELTPDAEFARATYVSMRYDTHNPVVSQWNLSVQRQLGTSWLASATYMGSNSVHLWTSRQLNPSVFIPGKFDASGNCALNGQVVLSGGRPGTDCSTNRNSDARRVLSLENPESGRLMGNVNLMDDGGTANYHGLLVSLQRRPARGVTLNMNYTWSHCISDLVDQNTSSRDVTGTDPANRRADRGNCTTSATDRRHVFNLTGVAETPQFANPTLRALATGWRLSPIFRIQSGEYLTVTTSSDIALTGLNQRVNQVMSDPYGDRSLASYLNPNAFALAERGRGGTIGVGNIQGPGFWQLNVALSRVFEVGETQRFELRAEAFNITNSLRKDNPTTNFNSGSFGQILSAQDPRIMQFALKYFF